MLRVSSSPVCDIDGTLVIDSCFVGLTNTWFIRMHVLLRKHPLKSEGTSSTKKVKSEIVADTIDKVLRPDGLLSFHSFDLRL